MVPSETLFSYFLACTLIILSPGPDNLLAIARGLSQSKLAAFASSLGADCGVIIHVLAAAFGLTVLIKASRLPSRNPEPLTLPDSMAKAWSMDFMSDKLHNRVRFRTFNVLDDYNREVLGIDIGTGMPAVRVTRYLDLLAAWHGYPDKVRVDNGPEFTSSEFMN